MLKAHRDSSVNKAVAAEHSKVTLAMDCLSAALAGARTGLKTMGRSFEQFENNLTQMSMREATPGAVILKIARTFYFTLLVSKVGFSHEAILAAPKHECRARAIFNDTTNYS